jgi:hypothetical protein
MERIKLNIPDVDLTPLDQQIKTLGRRIDQRMEEVGYYHVSLPDGLLIAKLKVGDLQRMVKASIEANTLVDQIAGGTLSKVNSGVYALRRSGPGGYRAADIKSDFRYGVLGAGENGATDFVFTIDGALAVLRNEQAIWSKLDMIEETSSN